MYCGQPLPEPAEAPSGGVALPDDLDVQLRAAMAHGHIEGLQEAIGLHQNQPKPQEPTQVDSPTLDVPPQIRLPKVRRRYALVIDGNGGPEEHPTLADILNIDGVTAKMLAMKRYPKIVIRGEDLEQLQTQCLAIRRKLGVKAIVVDQQQLLNIGMARLCLAFKDGIHWVNIPDWAQDMTGFQAPADPTLSRHPPRLVVPGEVVVVTYRSAPKLGRLKHLREGRLERVAEKRLAVFDLHTADGIVRILEGLSVMSDCPGAVVNRFRQSAKNLLDQFREQGVPVLEPRIAAPTQSNRATRETGWAQWEEHSRCARLLLIGPTTPTSVEDHGWLQTGPA